MKNKTGITILLIILLISLIGTECFILYKSDIFKSDNNNEQANSESKTTDKEKDSNKTNTDSKDDESNDNSNFQEEKATYQFHNIKVQADDFYQASGYAGASNHAIYLKDNIAYKLTFNGADSTETEIIANNVENIGLLDGSLIVYINDQTILTNNYSNYQINIDSNNNKYIII